LAELPFNQGKPIRSKGFDHRYPFRLIVNSFAQLVGTKAREAKGKKLILESEHARKKKKDPAA